MNISKRTAQLAFFALLSSAASAAPPRISEQWSNVFGGTKVTFHADASENLSWSFYMGKAVVARGDLAGGIAGPRAIEVDVPEMKPGVSFEGCLVVETSGGIVKHDIWIFPRDPWSDEKEALKKADIRLFDPENKTAPLLDAANVPFKSLRSAAALGEVKSGTVIVGEGISFVENRGLAAALVQAATAGANVICLAPREGLVELPGCGDDAVAKKPSLALRHGEVITEFDKHLDAAEWSDGAAISSTWHPSADRRRIEGEWRADAQGWPWIAAKFNGGGSLTYCGFGIVRSWEKTPAARFLLAAMLKDGTAEKR